MTEKSIRIGGASGFWGDSMMAAPQLVRGAALDYLVFDYLAEITMSIMARARLKDSGQGYARDFVEQTLREILADCATSGIKIISNAGGVNPLACGAAIEALIAELGVDLKVAVVTGDDLLDRVADFRESTEMFSGDPFPAVPISINAYLGATPIAAALDRGADIIVTGRCVDSALVLGACIHAFGWDANDLDRMAGASLAGHILECGAQATGGVFTDWEQVPRWHEIGYPIAEIGVDGSFTVTKPQDSGGLVTIGTVAEQMLYEIGDPQAYLLPDVVCDFSQVTIEQLGPDMVRVSGAKGYPPPNNYKVSVTYQDGYRLGLTLTICGIDADRKARRTGEAVLTRVSAMLDARGHVPFTETSVEILGAEACYGPHARIISPREVVLKIAAKHAEAEPLALLLREATSSGTSMSPGTTGMGGNRPKPMPLVRLFSCVLPKDSVTQQVHMGGSVFNVAQPRTTWFDVGTIRRVPPDSDPAIVADMVDIPLIRLAWGRSGDKGDSANIGIIARHADYLPWIRRALTEQAVAGHLRHLVSGSVQRFEVPGIHALNFLIANALGGGGIASLRNDPQGKSLAQLLLDHPIAIPSAIAARHGVS